MIQTYSTTIRRKEMDAVLTCMVDEKIGPGELNTRLIQQIKEFIKCDGCAALRSPAVALKFAFQALNIERGSKIIISSLAPAWQYQSLISMEMEPVVLDVKEENGLISAEDAEAQVAQGAKLILLHETEGILPELDKFASLGIPLIEDISQSAGAVYSYTAEDGNEVSKQAGTFGVYTILGLEEKDVLTAGGGAILMAFGRREWIVLKRYIDEAALTDLLPDINCALGWVQVKEFAKNEIARKEMYSAFMQSCMVGKHKLFAREMENGSTMSCFPLVLNSAFKDVKQYASRKDIEIQPAYENSVISYLLKKIDPTGQSELDEAVAKITDSCIHAKSLYLRCAHFPLYPRLTHAEVAKIVKVLQSLP